MDIISVIKNILSSLKSYLTLESIALFSIFITFLIYTLGKRYEIRMKKHGAKKEENIKFIKFFQNLYGFTKNGKTGEELLDDIDKSEFFNMGASLLIYGSRRLYRKYLFYREFSTNPIYSKRDYDVQHLSLYLLADIFKLIRKEVGLNTFNSVSSVEALGFFVNNFANNPVSKTKSYKARYRIMMIKVELFLVDRYNLLLIKRIYYLLIKPILGVIALLFKYLIMIPIGKLILRINPNAQEDLDKLTKRLDEFSRKKEE